MAYRKVDTAGDVLPDYRRDLEELIKAGRDLGHTVFCAPEHDGWKINSISAREAYVLDNDRLDAADVFVGILESDRPSTGVSMETMRSAMQKKQMLIITDKDNPVYMIRGMVEAEEFVTHAICPGQEARIAALTQFLLGLKVGTDADPATSS